MLIPRVPLTPGAPIKPQIRIAEAGVSSHQMALGQFAIRINPHQSTFAPECIQSALQSLGARAARPATATPRGRYGER